MADQRTMNSARRHLRQFPVAAFMLAACEASTGGLAGHAPDAAADGGIADVGARIEGTCVVLEREVAARTLGVCTQPSLGVDREANVHIGWVSRDQLSANYARREAPSIWTVEDPTDGATVLELALAVAPDGNRAILTQESGTSAVLYGDAPWRRQQTFGERFRPALAFDDDGVLHGLVASARSPGAEWIRGLHYLRGDADRLLSSLVVEHNGNVGGEMTLVEGGPVFFYATQSGTFAQRGLDQPVALELPDPEPPGSSTFSLLDHGRRTRADHLHVMQVRYNVETQREDHRLWSWRFDDRTWALTTTGSLQTRSRGPAVCDAEPAHVEGDRCEIDEEVYSFIGAQPIGEVVWAFYVRTHEVGAYRYSCVDFIGDSPCGWVDGPSNTYALVTQRITEGVGALEPSLVVPLDGPSTLDRQLGPNGAMHLAVAQRIAQDDASDECAVDYLKLDCR